MFDYLFYRAYKYYKSKDDLPFFSGLCFVIVVQAVMFFLLLTLVNVFTDGMFAGKNIGKNSSKIIGTVLLIGLGTFNYLRYKSPDRINKLYEKYENGTLNKKIKPWMIIFLVPFMILVAFILQQATRYYE